MGPGSIRQLARAGIRYDLASHVFITHFHPDHCADIVHFLFATRNPAVLSKREPFSMVGPTGLASLVKGLEEVFGHCLALPQGLMDIDELSTLQEDHRVYAGVEVRSCPTLHTDESLAYRVELEAGGSFVYSGDTGFNEGLIEFSRGAGLLILEASFPHESGTGHLTPRDAGHLAALAGVKRLLLTHFYPECLLTDIAGQCRSAFNGELTLGSDMLFVDL
jgi:ribonuclease BN (tRNA processing enzyme)